MVGEYERPVVRLEIISLNKIKEFSSGLFDISNLIHNLAESQHLE
jgi:hypothetical protein